MCKRKSHCRKILYKVCILAVVHIGEVTHDVAAEGKIENPAV